METYVIWIGFNFSFVDAITGDNECRIADRLVSQLLLFLEFSSDVTKLVRT
jgi:hypothetical protein